MKVEELPAYIQMLSGLGSHPGLSNINRLCQLLSEGGTLIQDRVPSIHIAGTNGKGSVGAMLSASFTQAGCRTGHFSSPAVFSYEEMFRIDGKSIGKKRLAQLYTTVEEACRKMAGEGYPHPTVFEVETAAAFLYFAQENCGLMVIECGMGGEGDATNVLHHPLECVFTSIGLDHQNFLGSTLGEIARQKAGIIVSSCPVVSARQQEEVSARLRERAKKHGCPFLEVPAGWVRDAGFRMEEDGSIHPSFYWRSKDGTEKEFTLSLAGTWQVENAALALLALEALRGVKVKDGFHGQAFPEGKNGVKDIRKEGSQEEASQKSVFQEPPRKEGFQEETLREWEYSGKIPSEEDARQAFLAVSWPGRLQCLGRVHDGPFLYMDGAHNPNAAHKLAKSLECYFTKKKIVFIMGVLSDKDYRQVLAILRPFGKDVFTVTPSNPRALSAERLAEAAREAGFDAHACGSVRQALDEAERQAEQEGSGAVILACGSLSWLEDLREAYKMDRRRIPNRP